MEYYRRILIAYEQEVLKNIPNPFGSFEKATYILSNTHSCRKNIYSFTTTVHNTKDAINLMKKIIQQRTEDQNRNYVIHKKQNGITTKIYSFNRFMNKLNGVLLN